MRSEDWQAIQNAEQLEAFLDLTKGLHDALSIHARWEGAEYLLPNRHVVLAGYGTLLIQVVSQFADVPALEIKFEKVKRFGYGYGGDTEPEIEFSRSGLRTRLLEWEIKSESVSYRTGEDLDRAAAARGAGQ